MMDEENVKSLEASQREALRECIKGVTEKKLSQRFDIHPFFRLPSEERNLFGFTGNELKAQVRKLLPKTHPDMTHYKSWNGKFVSYKCILNVDSHVSYPSFF